MDNQLSDEEKLNCKKADFSKFLIESLSFSYKCYKENSILCKTKFSEEAVHDFRVSIRRLLALIMMIENLLPNINSKPIKKILKIQLKSMNPLRDTQVQLLKIGILARKYPLLYSYFFHLATKEELLIKRIYQVIGNVDHTILEGPILFFKIEVRKKLISEYKNLTDLMNLGFELYNKVIELFHKVDINELDTIHKVRLQFKKFRYTMEVLNTVSNFKKSDIKKLKRFQTIMGEIQDNRVLVDSLNTFFSQIPKLPSTVYESVINKLLSDREKLLSKYINANLNFSFWK